MPKLFVTMVWDAGGINVLEEHPDAWPFTKSLDPEGHVVHRRDRRVVADEHRADPRDDRHRRVPDAPRHRRAQHARRRRDHRPRGTRARRSSSSRRSPTSTTGRWTTSRVVGIVGTVDIHFGMLGHGSFFSGGDRDIALTRSVIGGETLTDEGFEWNLPAARGRLLPARRVRERRRGVRAGQAEGGPGRRPARRQVARQRHRRAAAGLRHPRAHARTSSGWSRR